MKIFSTTILSSIALLSTCAFADIKEMNDQSLFRKAGKAVSEVIKWVGKTRCDSSSYRSFEKHNLQFIHEQTGESFDLNSRQLSEIHHESGNNFQIEIVAEKSDGFLFGDSSLNVKSFNITSVFPPTETEHRSQLSAQPSFRDVP